MSLRVVLIVTFIFFQIGLVEPAEAGCREAFERTQSGITCQHQSKSGDVFTYCVNSEHDQLDNIIDQVLELQQALLVNNLTVPIDPSKLDKGFLVTEMDPVGFKKMLRESRGELIGVCVKSDSLGSDDYLAGYLILTDLSEFESYYEDFDIGAFTTSISDRVWQAFLSNRQNKFIDQIAVSSQAKRSGIGSLLVDTARERSPTGLLADILFWPEPYVNQASYSFFTKKQGFEDIGTLHQKVFPRFRECKTRVVMWQNRESFVKCLFIED